MTVSYVERDQANTETLAFYDRSEERFQALLNIFKVFGHQSEYGTAFTDTIMAILKDSALDWKTKELLILKATQNNECQYCVVQHERVSNMLGISDEKIADLEGEKYKTSELYTEGERALLDFTVQIGKDANRVSKGLWDRLHEHWTDAQIVDAAFVITTYIAVSKFGDALGVELEPMFDGVDPILKVAH
ncbi:carboxymuconolactone decarboxylase family protein [Pseudohalocynthiibacter aestuariivivens]|jgi:AhpD family alkylhydroperoxidase|uniref:Carboxymuconolactone decarboxylase family protein n=1 Tax=Pseudohalocynthiibacter aestuariivivens TaxID=1591409 RepID=A0ABV5JGR4_9RHOB|nr:MULTISPECIES: carboxymuconolactone decarboxylase family protein [Pseudohalocynthiibacter]MBS9718146.1 carboxymuconolactone decarboxylase family protein [Pseudohalocynthiibacter aestuariivivens]MCK0103796.1 carboxymuconolactone decarboxylase family protein [Pseudohalocynthiibacter sp. F2068]